MALGVRTENTEIWFHTESICTDTGHDQPLNQNQLDAHNVNSSVPIFILTMNEQPRSNSFSSYPKYLIRSPI